MKTFFRSLLASTLLATATLAAQAQPSAPTAAAATPTDTARLTLDPGLINPVSMQSFEAFRTAVQPLVKQMAGKKVVAMGEGTHGTAEFYKLRFWLTRILMEEHSFDRLGLENTYGDTYLLNQALQQRTATTDLKPLMQKHLISMWQNQEMVELLTWMQARNRRQRRQVELTGIDNMFTTADAQLLQQGLAKAKNPEVQAAVAQLLKSAQYNDNYWYKLSDKTFKRNRPEWLSSGYAGYLAAEKLVQLLPATKLPRKQREVLAGAAKNAHLGLDVFYQYEKFKRDSSRDSAFAEMTKFIAGGSHKVIIWAHNAHVGRTVAATDDRSNGGGTGDYLERMFPGQYFVLATATGAGTFAATQDVFISPASVMASYPLSAPKAGSWEAAMSQVSSPLYFFDTHQLGAQDLKRPHRLVGQTVGGEDYYADTQLGVTYDAMLFVRQGTAATPLR
ncbi:erythromycin esterase-like protein [Hymenobacter luteus]|uniref:Erythromycin esterase-like protein n=2 Tax=Hymenobacter TaxID=89966 RepID=A0A7W9SZC6_9BACT|nr:MULTISPECIES: erythromycin esterase family protein [Hymenobacter]MBB4599716.1 erythromycin esterase-like protein [Hymenobacter latericoloratus]MBB6057974.1 erythromycin esterase-like protein [Hymenobacter luteus]